MFHTSYKKEFIIKLCRMKIWKYKARAKELYLLIKLSVIIIGNRNLFIRQRI